RCPGSDLDRLRDVLRQYDRKFPGNEVTHQPDWRRESVAASRAYRSSVETLKRSSLSLLLYDYRQRRHGRCSLGKTRQHQRLLFVCRHQTDAHKNFGIRSLQIRLLQRLSDRIGISSDCELQCVRLGVESVVTLSDCAGTLQHKTVFQKKREKRPVIVVFKYGDPIFRFDRRRSNTADRQRRGVVGPTQRQPHRIAKDPAALEIVAEISKLLLPDFKFPIDDLVGADFLFSIDAKLHAEIEHWSLLLLKKRRE